MAHIPSRGDHRVHTHTHTTTVKRIITYVYHSPPQSALAASASRSITSSSGLRESSRYSDHRAQRHGALPATTPDTIRLDGHSPAARSPRYYDEHAHTRASEALRCRSDAVDALFTTMERTHAAILASSTAVRKAANLVTRVRSQAVSHAYEMRAQEAVWRTRADALAQEATASAQRAAELTNQLNATSQLCASQSLQLEVLKRAVAKPIPVQAPQAAVSASVDAVAVEAETSLFTPTASMLDAGISDDVRESPINRNIRRHIGTEDVDDDAVIPSASLARVPSTASVVSLLPRQARDASKVSVLHKMRTIGVDGASRRGSVYNVSRAGSPRMSVISLPGSPRQGAVTSSSGTPPLHVTRPTHSLGDLVSSTKPHGASKAETAIVSRSQYATSSSGAEPFVGVVSPRDEVTFATAFAAHVHGAATAAPTSRAVHESVLSTLLSPPLAPSAEAVSAPSSASIPSIQTHAAPDALLSSAQSLLARMSRSRQASPDHSSTGTAGTPREASPALRTETSSISEHAPLGTSGGVVERARPASARVSPTRSVAGRPRSPVRPMTSAILSDASTLLSRMGRPTAVPRSAANTPSPERDTDHSGGKEPTTGSSTSAGALSTKSASVVRVSSAGPRVLHSVSSSPSSSGGDEDDWDTPDEQSLDALDATISDQRENRKALSNMPTEAGSFDALLFGRSRASRT